jgi:hypothetical protein
MTSLARLAGEIAIFQQLEMVRDTQSDLRDGCCARDVYPRRHKRRGRSTNRVQSGRTVEGGVRERMKQEDQPER